MQEMKRINAELQEENYKIKQRDDYEPFKSTDTPRNIARVLIEMLSGSKIDNLIAELRTMRKSQKAKTEAQAARP
jgi:hypothetical protein